MWENRHLFDCPIKNSLELFIGSRIDLMFHKPEAKNTKLMLAKQNIEGQGREAGGDVQNGFLSVFLVR